MIALPSSTFPKTQPRSRCIERSRLSSRCSFPALRPACRRGKGSGWEERGRVFLPHLAGAELGLSEETWWFKGIILQARPLQPAFWDGTWGGTGRVRSGSGRAYKITRTEQGREGRKPPLLAFKWSSVAAKKCIFIGAFLGNGRGRKTKLHLNFLARKPGTACQGSWLGLRSIDDQNWPCAGNCGESVGAV